LFSGSMINGEMQTIPLITDNYTSKPTTNFIYCFSVGTTININQEVNLDLAYSYKDFGKPKYKREDIPNIPPVKRYKGHNFSIGIRFDL
jgi:opacity protein-like surface antigen